MRLQLLVCLSILLAGSGRSFGINPSDDLSQWQGSWTLIACLYDGETQTANEHWVVNGDRYNVVSEQQTEADPYSFELDPATKHVLAMRRGASRETYGARLKGAYRISGDTLTVVYDLTGAQYPASFDAEQGSRRVLYQFHRERP